jgi:competence protein ComFC
MRCLHCGTWAFKLLCPVCQKQLLTPKPSQRVLLNGLKVNSFFAYDDIAFLLHAKHKVYGSFIFELLAKHSFEIFAKTFHFPEKILAVPIDDRIKDGYSHTAILAKALKSDSIKPRYKALQATTSYSYSGQSLAFRKSHPRRFVCKLPKNSKVILVDDLITSGQTLLEASELLKKFQITPLFALTLANANLN